MDKAFASVVAPGASARKAAARAALVDLNDSSRALLSDCFRQFGIETAIMTGQAAERLHKEKFEACVLSLGQDAGNLMETVRLSRSNSRCIIYGVGGSAQETMRYSKYGINAMFQEPLERPAALKLVRATHMLVLHEFRRYVRIPVMTEVGIVLADGGRMTATSQEISSGGMSLKGNHVPEQGSLVEVSFSLLTLPRVWVRGHVTWKKPNKNFGIRFDATDERRQRLKEWIVAYLEA